MVSPPCTRPCHTLYKTLGHLVPDPGTPCTRLWHNLYQTLEHLVPEHVTSYTRPWHNLYQTLCHTLYQTLSNLVLDSVIPCTIPCNTLYKILPVHREFISKVVILKFFFLGNCECSNVEARLFHSNANWRRQKLMLSIASYTMSWSHYCDISTCVSDT